MAFLIFIISSVCLLNVCVQIQNFYRRRMQRYRKKQWEAWRKRELEEEMTW